MVWLTYIGRNNIIFFVEPCNFVFSWVVICTVSENLYIARIVLNGYTSEYCIWINLNLCFRRTFGIVKGKVVSVFVVIIEKCHSLQFGHRLKRIPFWNPCRLKM